MGRPPSRTIYREHRRRLAQMIDAALVAGHRGDGRAPMPPWSYLGFARLLGCEESNVRSWRALDNPSRPVNIIPILKAFYGDRPEHKDARQAMLVAWRLAGGLDAEEAPPEPRAIVATQFNEVAEVVYLLVNQPDQPPIPDNSGQLILPFTLRFRLDRNRKVRIIRGGKPEDVKIDIGLMEPLFAVASTHWQPVAKSMFRAGKHPRTKPGPFRDSVQLIGEKDPETQVIIGEPFEADPKMVLERHLDATGEEVITLSVLTSCEGFHVKPSDGGADMTPTQKAVQAALLASAIPRDGSDRLVLERVQVRPGAKREEHQ